MKKEVRIALVAIAALIVLFFGMNFLKGISVFSDNQAYKITFGDIGGVQKNCPIYARGVAIGSVSAITYDYSLRNPTELTVMISKAVRIPRGSQAEVKSDLMGNTQINLILADDFSETLSPGDTIVGLDDDGTIERLKAMIPAMEAMVPKLDSIMTSLNLILGEPAIRNILHNTEGATANLEKASAELNTLVAQLNKDVPGMMRKADSVLDNTEKLTGGLAQIDIDATMAQVNKTLAEVNATMAKINSTEGTMGKMLNDPELYDNLNATMRDADKLVVDLRENPKRYVHFSVFGRKSN